MTTPPPSPARDVATLLQQVARAGGEFTLGNAGQGRWHGQLVLGNGRNRDVAERTGPLAEVLAALLDDHSLVHVTVEGPHAVPVVIGGRAVPVPRQVPRAHFAGTH